MFRSLFVAFVLLTSAAFAQSPLVSTDEWWNMDPNVPLSPWWLCGGPWLSIGFRIVRPLGEGTAEEWTRYWEADSEELKKDVESSIQSGRGINGRPLMSPRIRKPLGKFNNPVKAK